MYTNIAGNKLVFCSKASALALHGPFSNGFTQRPMAADLVASQHLVSKLMHRSKYTHTHCNNPDDKH